jgi:hypothetical protein
MRNIHMLPLAGAIMLAACGGGAEGEGTGEDVAAENVVAQAAGMPQPRPGQYRVSVELLEFDIPGLPAAAKQQAQEFYASGLSSHTFCLTPEDAANNGAEQMVKGLADSDDCTMKSFNVSGGTVVSEMQCAMDGGITSTMRTEGEITSEGSTMTMDTTQTVPDAGETRTKMRMTTERIGDCAA